MFCLSILSVILMANTPLAFEQSAGFISRPLVLQKQPKAESEKPTSHTNMTIEGWTIRVDDRLLQESHSQLKKDALRFLESKLFEITVIVPEEHLKKLRTVTIVLDLTHGNLGAMQYHPSAGWLKSNGYSEDLARCVHLPRAADLATKRNIREQPWVILHELAHAYHDQFLSFDEPRVIEAYERYKKSGRGEKTLLHNGSRVKHYALTNHKEFFAEMTESYFGSNDFFPFNRAELKESEPEIYELMDHIWNRTTARKDAPKAKKPAVPPKSPFMVDGRPAFVIMPERIKNSNSIPWVWYAPTFPNLPEEREYWMFEQFLAAGIAIAGVDVGESYGSPRGRAIYTSLYQELVTKRKFAPKPVLLARSRGGLMLYNWAVENADRVGGIGGIYPVCDLRSYPGLEKASPAYGLTRDELEKKLSEHNPVERLTPLAKAGVPIFHIHGDTDKVVPLKENSQELATRYKKLGGTMTLKIANDQGHNLWEGFFQCQELVDFVVKHSATHLSDSKR